MIACAFHALTNVVLPFTTSTHNPPTVPDDVIDMLKVAQPQVLILPAGLAIQDLKSIRSIKAIIVVDITTAPHMDWNDDDGGVPVHTWQELLNSGATHQPAENPAAIAIQSFVRAEKGYKSVEFTQQV
jgi:hypothetical protein